MRRSVLALALLLAVVGLAWVGQGTGVIGGSVMSGSAFWAVVGVILLVVAAVVVAREARRAPK